MLMAEDLSDGADRWSHSVGLRAEWRDKPQWFPYVSKSVPGDDYGWEPGIFRGVRSNERILRPLR